MIKVDKDFEDIPTILKSSNRKEVFMQNILKSDYVDVKNRYKVKSIQKKLSDIYHLKCAYCEKKLLDVPKHIEHYRPKRGGYYWLAYSWDNLLLSCGECNSAKGNKFPTAKSRVTYNNEPFEDIHNLGDNYDRLEEPQIINPEKEDISYLLKFDKDGVIFSEDPRVAESIKICNLNREPLVKLRQMILTDFRKDMEGHLEYFKLKGDTSRFIPTVKRFMEDINTENEFYAFRYFVLKNLDVFFEDNEILAKLSRKIIHKLTQ